MGSAQSTASLKAPTQYSSSSADGLNEKLAALEEDFSNVTIHGRPSATLQLDKFRSWEADMESNPTLKLSQTVMTHTEIPTALISRTAGVAQPHVYNTSVDFLKGLPKVTNQKSSGRCWLFATTNVARYAIMKKLNLDQFECSQAYLFFYDKLEKSNYYLENSIDLWEEPLDGRLVSFLAQAPINDGGQYDMAANLLETYGLVPQALFPESVSSSSSSKVNGLLTSYLRQSALMLRKALEKGYPMVKVRSMKEEMMKHVYQTLCICLGTPPKPDEAFTWSYYDKDGKYAECICTPIEFAQKYASSPAPMTESFSLINDPRNAYGKLYTVDRLGNIWGSREVLYVNTEVKRLKDAAIAVIKKGHPVFFGCDVGAFSTRDGLMSLDIFDYTSAFNLKLSLTKAERLAVGDSAMTHAMVLSAVHLDGEGKPVRWRVENSWGTEAGQNGYMVMTDDWFSEFVYQVVVPKVIADKDLVKIFEGGDKVVLNAWDPMGALA